MRSTPSAKTDWPIPPAEMRECSLASLRRAVQACQACDLYRHATQAVFGAGPARAAVMLIGEVPGDQEDQVGKPFVGPAGKLLDEALAEAGSSRKAVYVTNAVKHFKWEPRGKRRLHAKPNSREIHACRPWLDAEISRIEPQVIVCLGATAAQALFGSSFRLTHHLGEFLESSPAAFALATYHPSAILRAPTPEHRQEMKRQLFDDLRRAIARL
jgi:uracil-DNA glycosylase